MNKSSKNIIKSLLMSAAFTLLHSNNANAENTQNPSLALDGLDNKKQELEKGKNNIFNNVYKIRRDGDIQLIAAHRSHRSHSSHRSHRSSTVNHKYTPSSKSKVSKSSKSTSTSISMKTIATYSLGDRTLKKGFYGADVDELVKLLIRNHYIKVSHLKKKNGYYLYDVNIEKAIKHFQKDAGWNENGEVDYLTLSKLKGWDEDKTTIELGFRDITLGIFGYDVDELVRLLTKAGYAPDSIKQQKKGEHYIYTEDIQMAIKTFQADNKLDITGELNEQTINILKKVDK